MVILQNLELCEQNALLSSWCFERCEALNAWLERLKGWDSACPTRNRTMRAITPSSSACVRRNYTVPSVALYGLRSVLKCSSAIGAEYSPMCFLNAAQEISTRPFSLKAGIA